MNIYAADNDAQTLNDDFNFDESEMESAPKDVDKMLAQMSIETVETRGKFIKNKKSKKQKTNKEEEEKVPDLDNRFNAPRNQDPRDDYQKLDAKESG